ncbi:MAG: amidohydrolase family protein [Oscillospiraceae bacterium]|nr:amidohydrolase family protein [Oscillospiraceae bacterium]
MKDFIIKGQVLDSAGPELLRCRENSYIVVTEGLCRGVFPLVPEQYAGLPVTDFGTGMILPGMSDLHLHAAQFGFRGLGMDMELLDWLERYTFPEEARFSDLRYAEQAYSGFVSLLRRSCTTRAAVFASVHREATLLLMEKLEASGLRCYVGKVNMDRNCPDYIREPDAQSALRDTEEWILQAQSFAHTKPILTPRFIPTCSDPLMRGLKELQRKYALPTQSHLSENYGEIAWVRELSPDAAHYGDAYARFGMFGGDHPCIMAHCVHSGEEELELIRRNGVFIAHSPESNMNLASGVAPVSRYLSLGLRVGLASDLAGGSSENMLRAMTHAIQASKLRWRLADQEVKPLSLEQAFWMATAGGGAFFGKVGRFEPGFALDAVVLDDSSLSTPRPLRLRDRLERAVYLADERHITAKFVDGVRLF